MQENDESLAADVHERPTKCCSKTESPVHPYIEIEWLSGVVSKTAWNGQEFKVLGGTFRNVDWKNKGGFFLLFIGDLYVSIKGRTRRHRFRKRFSRDEKKGD